MTDRATTQPETQPDPLAIWRGDFGTQYIQRCPLTPEHVAETADVFARILRESSAEGQIQNVLEVGATLGASLEAMRAVLGPDARLSAVEPNEMANEALRTHPTLNLEAVYDTDAAHLPMEDGAYDLVFTKGVLIHIPPDHLAAVQRELCRVSGRYVLALEYFSHVPTEINYRGQTGLLWKRDFGRDYLENCPDLEIAGYGFLWQCAQPHFDNVNWWMFRKKS